jgi:hypothetical protein
MNHTDAIAHAAAIAEHARELEKLRVLADFNARRTAARAETLALIARAAK